MDYVLPAQIVADALRAAETKVRLSIPNLIIRGALAGAFLGYATSLVFVALSQGLPPIVGAIIFPVGFVMLVLLGLELATGNFALLPASWLVGRAGVVPAVVAVEPVARHTRQYSRRRAPDWRRAVVHLRRQARTRRAIRGNGFGRGGRQGELGDVRSMGGDPLLVGGTVLSFL